MIEFREEYKIKNNRVIYLEHLDPESITESQKDELERLNKELKEYEDKQYECAQKRYY